MHDDSLSTIDVYTQALADYFKSRSESALYRASLLSQTFVENGLGPEDIVALHFEALDKALPGHPYREHARLIGDAGQFLLEVMIAYGIQYKEYLELRSRETMREVEEQAVEAARRLEMERAHRDRDDILAVIAHEMRTPITAAMGSLQLASRSLSRGDLARLPPLLEGTRSALERLSRLSADLVESSRGGTHTLQRAPLELGDVVRQACSWASAAALAQDVELTFPEVDASPAGVRVVGDANALLSVCGNLLANAIRYTPSGGRVQVRYGVRNHEAWFEVADTGIGMTAETQMRVFDKFYRAPEAQVIESQGLGLGLALVHQLVLAHEGHVEVESDPGHGSTFRVVLPSLPAILEPGDSPLPRRNEKSNAKRG